MLPGPGRSSDSGPLRAVTPLAAGPCAVAVVLGPCAVAVAQGWRPGLAVAPVTPNPDCTPHFGYLTPQLPTTFENLWRPPAADRWSAATATACRGPSAKRARTPVAHVAHVTPVTPVAPGPLCETITLWGGQRYPGNARGIPLQEETPVPRSQGRSIRKIRFFRIDLNNFKSI